MYATSQEVLVIRDEIHCAISSRSHKIDKPIPNIKWSRFVPFLPFLRLKLVFLRPKPSESTY